MSEDGCSKSCGPTKLPKASVMKRSEVEHARVRTPLPAPLAKVILGLRRTFS